MNPAAESTQQAEFDCPCGEQAEFDCPCGGARLCIGIGYRPAQLDANGAPKSGEAAARVKGPDNSHKASFGGSRPSRDIVNETITWSENYLGRPLAGWWLDRTQGPDPYRAHQSRK